ncbi:helix-turn-helix domain-containing protein [Aquabacterium sp.]|uniref:helix-turn-helix domain-containing protein n=1 Tax=Aquabacterium sp. TaxID=1872578 RepID=UPI002D08BA11|nr:helix-turn-helix domain-containing protein [Aquabacterium sp.]HSW06223.1 helix-turn-helix domain-containing protein [Aquabacterium sp.]
MAAVTGGGLPAAAVRQWSTDAVDAGRRLDYWVGAICEAFLEMDCSSRQPTAFEGRLTSVRCADLIFNQVLAETQDVYRTAAGIARGEQHPFYLIVQRDGVWQLRQHGHVQQLRPGDVALVDSAQRYELHFPESFAVMSIQLPRHWLGQWLTNVDSALPRVALRDRGWGRTLSALCLQLADEPALAHQYPQPLLSGHLGALLAAAFEPAAGAAAPAASERGLATRARQLMAERLGQHGLVAESVAGALGVSVRTLHRGFAAEQATFAGSLRAMRLAQARQMLQQPRLARLAVGEIAHRCGFGDASHFVREFHQAFGTTPARWRRSGPA